LIVDSVLEQFVLDCRALFGDDLRSVFLYGSAAAEDFVPGVSDYNLGVVLKEVRPEHLRRASTKVRAWARRRVSPPLLLDLEFMRRSLDVFPIEFLEMKAAHRTLFGPDPFVDLHVSGMNLRLQCEFEIKSKLLRLRGGVLRANRSPRALLSLAMGSLKSILLILRNYLRLRGESVPSRLPSVLDRIEAREGLALPTLRRLLAVREGQEKLKRREIEALVETYLEEVELVAERLDSVSVAGTDASREGGGEKTVSGGDGPR
jgi:predicted nucleotidyltransferase